MADKSKIEWTGSTWNPVTGCTKVSPGCAHCYIERQASFRVARRKFDPKTGSTGMQLHPDRLTQPLHWKRPRIVFVNSMSDLFHEAISIEFIDDIFAVMALCPQHSFQILTKRPERMRGYFGSHYVDCWPLPNVWLGVTCENQRFADERIPALLQTPAAKRFVSYEPALGPLDLFGYAIDELGANVDWVICGGESGPKARPMNLAWTRSVRDQCKAAGVPFFMKQICNAKGRKIPMEQWPEDLRVREMP